MLAVSYYKLLMMMNLNLAVIKHAGQNIQIKKFEIKYFKQEVSRKKNVRKRL